MYRSPVVNYFSGATPTAPSSKTSCTNEPQEENTVVKLTFSVTSPQSTSPSHEMDLDNNYLSLSNEEKVTWISGYWLQCPSSLDRAMSNSWVCWVRNGKKKTFPRIRWVVTIVVWSLEFIPAMREWLKRTAARWDGPLEPFLCIILLASSYRAHR